jgi:hypothetical protein
MFSGKKNEMSFLTLVDKFTEDKIIQNYAFIYYRLKGDKLMRLCRENQEALNDKSKVEPQELGSHIEEIAFSYGDFIAADQRIDWKDLWDNTEVLPVAVKVRLSLKNKTKQSFERIIYLAL